MKITLAIILTILLISCGHHRDVRPGMDGTNKVVIASDSKENGSRAALDQAIHFCKERNLYPAIISESSKYTGSMDEKSYHQAKTVSRVAQVVGGGVTVLGNSTSTRTLGGATLLGGTAVNAAAGNGYTVEMVFGCK